MERLDNFSVYINRNVDSFANYIKLCKKHDIDFDRTWSGNTTHYGTKNNKSFCDDKSFGSRKFGSLKAFQSFIEHSYEIF